VRERAVEALERLLVGAALDAGDGSVPGDVREDGATSYEL